MAPHLLARLVPRTAATIAVAALAALFVAAPAGAAPDVGQRSFKYGTAVSAPTSDKPQSKLWYTTDAQGKVTWWATMWNGSKFLIYRFDSSSSTWQPTSTEVDNRSLAVQDALWDGSHLYVASNVCANPSRSGALCTRPSQDPSLASVDSLATLIMRFSFNPATQTWTKDWETPVNTKNDVPVTSDSTPSVAKNCAGQLGTFNQCVGGTESVTLAKDSAGRVWVTDTRDTGVTPACATGDPNPPGTCVQATAGSTAVPQWTSTGRSVYVYHSLSADGPGFSAPYLLPVGSAASQVTWDDISSVVAFDDKVGVFWDNQTTGSFYFATHDAANGNDQAWSSQTAFAGFPGYTGGEWSDDHFNVKTLESDPAGQVFAVVKTSRNDLDKKGTGSHNGDPVTVFLRRSAGGTWSGYSVNGVNRQGSIDYSPTRAILSLDPTNRTAYVFSSSPCCSGGTIYEKLSNMDNPSFPGSEPGGYTNLGTRFMVDGSVSGGGLNNPTTSKQPAPVGDFLYVLAGQVQTDWYWWNRIAITKPIPPLKPGDCPGDPRCPKQPPVQVCPGDPNCPKPPPTQPTQPNQPVQPPKPKMLKARNGAISAELSFVPNADGAALDIQLRILRSGRTLLAGAFARQCRSCSAKIEGANGHAPKLAVVRLQSRREPQVLVTFQTRGRTLTLFYRVRRGRLAKSGVNWGIPGFTLRDLGRDRIPELLTRDTRFQRITGGGPDTFLPLKVLSFRDGRLVVVTRHYRRALASDATKLLRTYRALRHRRGHDLRGVLAAWAADMTLLGKGAQVTPVLKTALRHRELQSRGGAARGSRFVSWLPRFVRAAGYRR